jgi:hypothetical protein
MASLSDALVKQLLGGRYIASFATQNPNGSIHAVAVCRETTMQKFIANT